VKEEDTMADLENKNTSASEKAVKAEKKPKKDKVKLSTRIATAFRSYKSEVKKIVWSPWNQVRKNTLVVVVVIVASAAAVGLLDYAFSQGLIALGALL
jgi:preprotein translocase SecE subunit